MNTKHDERASGLAQDEQKFRGRSAAALLAPFVGLAVPVGAVLVALSLGAVMLLTLGANPITGYAALIDGAFGGWDELADTSIKAMPLLLVGVGICIAFRAGVINIGGEGQIIAGAIASTVVALVLPDVSRILLVPLVLVGGAIGGGLWGAIPGVLKAYAGVNEILSTIMMNLVAAQFLSFLLQDLLTDKASGAIKIQQTERLSANADLPLLPGDTRLHLGVMIAILIAVLGHILLFRSALGVRLRAVGHNADASRYAGMPVKKSIVQALAFSGACAGVAGAVLVFGSESHRLIAEGGASGFTQSAGFNGIVAALFGGLSPLAVVPASFFFGGMLTGGISLQQELQVPAALIVALNGIVVLFVVGSLKLQTRLRSWAQGAGSGSLRRSESPPSDHAPQPADSVAISEASDG
ncbi:ABC transporter permease [Ilumatobacter sp.]|uniref:ABC transporter permease n=1 Tax=Ilumatobacter sp. TaxID=1967498 RepID=UPI0030B74D84